MTSSFVSKSREAVASRARHTLRAAGIVLLVGIGTLPVLLGRARCPAALLLRRPCPGCGMTRAAHLLMAGDVAGSLRIHPLLVPNVLATAAVVLAVVWATYRTGMPLDVWRTPWGKAALVAFGAVQAAVLMVWVLRFLGWFGGPVPV